MSVQSTPAQGCKYNLRSKNSTNPRKVYYESDLSSDSDSNYSESDMEESNSVSDDSFIVDDSDEEKDEIDDLEYKKFLSKMFPSNYSRQKLDAEKKFRKISKKLLKRKNKNCNIIIGNKQIFKNSANQSKKREDSEDELLNIDIDEKSGEEESDNESNAEDLKSNSSNSDSDNSGDESDKEESEDEKPLKKKKLNNEDLIHSLVTLANEKLKKKKAKISKDKNVKRENLKKFKKLIEEKDNLDDSKYFKNHIEESEQNILISKLENINRLNYVTKPYRIILLEANIPDQWKVIALKKLSMLENMDPTIGEYFKLKNWVDTFMRIPFNNYIPLPIKYSDGIEQVNTYMENSVNILNKAVYGLDDAKIQIMQLIGQWLVNPDSIGSAIAIKGPMGTGKTTLVKEGISKILNRPFELIALGGATDSSTLEGHGYTYEGSTWGKIVDILVNTKCSNPIIYFDELDKISDTPKGEEITGILTHLIDSSQNDKFHDKYFSEIDFNLSRALFIFSYNDDSKVNTILKDRMYKISTKGYNKKEKITIANNYLIPTISSQVLFEPGNVIIDDNALEYIIENYTEEEQGVRNLKRCLEIIFTKLNLYRLMKPNTDLFKKENVFEIKFPINIDNKIIDKLIKMSKEQNDNWKKMYM